MGDVSRKPSSGPTEAPAGSRKPPRRSQEAPGGPPEAAGGPMESAERKNLFVGTLGQPIPAQTRTIKTLQKNLKKPICGDSWAAPLLPQDSQKIGFLGFPDVF